MIENRTAINGKPCITFKQRTTETNYVYVYNDNGCFSYVFFKVYNKNKNKNLNFLFKKVGMTGGKQSLSLWIGNQNTGTCLTRDTVAHEFIHALGNMFLKYIF